MEEEETSLGPLPLTSQSPGCSRADINIFIAAAAAAGLSEMSLLWDDAGEEQGDDGEGKGERRV